MKFKIERSNWARGKRGPGQLTMLFNPNDQSKCCLGFFMEACGHTLDQLKDVGEPEGVAETQEGLNEECDWLVGGEVDDDGFWNSDAAALLIEANDNERITEREREKQVTKLFEKQGVTVEFVD